MTLNDFFRRTLSNIEIVSNCFLVNRYSIELYFDIDIRRDRIDLVLSLSTSYWFGCSSKSYWFVCFFMDIVRKTIISISIDIVSHVFSFIGIVSILFSFIVIRSMFFAYRYRIDYNLHLSIMYRFDFSLIVVVSGYIFVYRYRFDFFLVCRCRIDWIFCISISCWAYFSSIGVVPVVLFVYRYRIDWTFRWSTSYLNSRSISNTTAVVGVR